MADEYTPNLGLTKPDVGYSDDTWGEKLNINFDKIDANIVPLSEFGEVIDDRVAALLQAGANVTITYDDAGNKITIASSGGGGGDGVSVTMSVDPPASPVAGNLWFESDTGLLYIYYVDPTPNSYWVALTTLSGGGGAPPSDTNPLMNGVAAPGVATLYARGDHVHPSDTTKLSKSANLSDVANAVTSRQNIYAAPFDALAYSGIQINGSMEVNQPDFTALGGNGRMCDGWSFLAPTPNGDLWCSANATSIVPGIRGYIGMQPTAGKPSLAAGDMATFYQQIEGYRASRLAWGTTSAQPLTIAFWARHVRTGLYSVSVTNADNSRACVLTYSQAVSNAIEYHMVTFPGCTDGVWDSSNGIGLSIGFCSACGTTYTAPAAGVWYAQAYRAAPGQVNAVAAPSDINVITGVIVLPGIEAPSAARSELIMRPYDQELLTCQRYYEKRVGVVFRAQAIASIFYWLPSVVKRSAPTSSLANITNSGSTGGSIANPKIDGVEISFSATAVGGYLVADVITDARL